MKTTFVEISEWLKEAEHVFDYDDNSKEEGDEFAKELYTKGAIWVGIDPEDTSDIHIELDYNRSADELLDLVDGLDELEYNTHLNVTYTAKDNKFINACAKGRVKAAQAYLKAKKAQIENDNIYIFN